MLFFACVNLVIVIISGVKIDKVHKSGDLIYCFYLLFPHPPERKKYFEMSSFVETKGMDILKSSPTAFVEYPWRTNQCQQFYFSVIY